MRYARIAAAPVAALCLLVAGDAHASDPDPWFGRDKAYHFAASAGIAATGYTVGAAFFDARGYALIAGGALSLAAGAGKELLDLTGLGDPSWRDFTWDCIGNVTGLLVAWSADLLIRGVNEEHPLLIAPTVTPTRAAVQVVISF